MFVSVCESVLDVFEELSVVLDLLIESQSSQSSKLSQSIIIESQSS